MWPSCLSDQNSRSCLCREKTMDTAALMLLLPSFFFFFFYFSSQGFRIYWVALFLKGHFFSNFWGAGVLRWWGIAAYVVKETEVHECVVHTCVSMSQLLSTIASLCSGPQA